MMNDNYISPLPKVWNEIHQKLLSYWENELNKKTQKPPVPLILAGWNFSEDSEKKLRWGDTLQWGRKK